MPFNSTTIPALIQATSETIETHSQEVTALDQILGDGDHVTNLQRGLNALTQESTNLATLEASQALQKIGMTLLSTMGGASGSLFGTLFISMSKAAKEKEALNFITFSDIFDQAVDSVKKRGKSDAGEKTMLDVLIPVAESMKQSSQSATDWPVFLDNITLAAEKGMLSTREMLATKGRASYLGEKSIGHIDAGARTSQLMICAIVKILKQD